MPWFRVDDGFGRHPKVLGIPRKDRPAAVGLWLLAGTWCSASLADGRVPSWLPEEFGGSKRIAGLLVEAGLWLVDGDGWRFHEWETYQPTRAQVEDQRSKTAERVAKWRGKRRGDDDGNAGGNGVTPPPGNAPSNGGGNSEVTQPPVPVPVPYLSTSVVVSSHQGDARVDGPTDDDLEAWTTNPPTGVDLAAERRRFREHNAGAWDALRDPRKAWLGWLQAAGRRQTAADRPTPVPERPHCPLHPDQPTGSQQCPTCAAEAAPAPDLRAALRRTPKEIPA